MNPCIISLVSGQSVSSSADGNRFVVSCPEDGTVWSFEERPGGARG